MCRRRRSRSRSLAGVLRVRNRGFRSARYPRVLCDIMRLPLRPHLSVCLYFLINLLVGGSLIGFGKPGCYRLRSRRSSRSSSPQAPLPQHARTARASAAMAAAQPQTSALPACISSSSTPRLTPGACRGSARPPQAPKTRGANAMAAPEKLSQLSRPAPTIAATVGREVAVQGRVVPAEAWRVAIIAAASAAPACPMRRSSLPAASLGL